ncbi:MAG: hypothetical protein H0Z33_06680 [Bacillaceae bacterium]|nr:hypothetical protein [Bacillaceae bacterium]
MRRVIVLIISALLIAGIVVLSFTIENELSDAQIVDKLNEFISPKLLHDPIKIERHDEQNTYLVMGRDNQNNTYIINVKQNRFNDLEILWTDIIIPPGKRDLSWSYSDIGEKSIFAGVIKNPDIDKIELIGDFDSYNIKYVTLGETNVFYTIFPHRIKSPRVTIIGKTKDGKIIYED